MEREGRGMPRDFDDDHKLSVRSFPDAHKALDDVIKNVKHDGVFYRTFNPKPSKISKASVVNALILWLYRQSDERQRAILGESHADLDLLLKEEGMSLGLLEREVSGRQIITPKGKAAARG